MGDLRRVDDLVAAGQLPGLEQVVDRRALRSCRRRRRAAAGPRPSASRPARSSTGPRRTLTSPGEVCAMRSRTSGGAKPRRRWTPPTARSTATIAAPARQRPPTTIAREHHAPSAITPLARPGQKRTLQAEGGDPDEPRSAGSASRASRARRASESTSPATRPPRARSSCRPRSRSGRRPPSGPVARRGRRRRRRAAPAIRPPITHAAWLRVRTAVNTIRKSRKFGT